MGNTKKLTDNPFFRLNTTPRTDPEGLINAAADVELLSGVPAQDALNQLMHPGERLAAELSFLPGASDEEIRMVRSYLLSARPGTMPELNLSSRLALFNAAAAFLENWPIEDVPGAEAACLCLAGISKDITAEKVKQEINEDRAAGGYQPLSADINIRLLLREHLQGIFTGLAERCMAAFPPKEIGLLKMELAEAYRGNNPEYRHVQALSELVCTHLSHSSRAAAEAEATIIRSLISEIKAEALEQDAPKNREQVSRSNQRRQACFIRQKLDILIPVLREWNALTMPERIIASAKGYTEDSVKRLNSEMGSLLIILVDKWQNHSGTGQLFGIMEEVFTDSLNAKRS